MNTLPPFAARLLALVLVAGSITVAHSAPRWEQVVSSGPGHYYIDPASITKDGERRTFDSALDYRHPKTSAAGKAYQSVATQFQVNCRMKMARIVHMTYYSGPMLAGSVVERQGMLHEWMEVDASSPVHRLMRYAC
jgi:hypothetical protein